MSEEVDKNYLASLDRRITDHDNKISTAQRDHTELVQEIKQLMERINQGVSPSVNAVRQENSEIKLTLSDLSHKMDMNMMEMKSTVRESADLTRTMLNNFENSHVEPLEKEVGFMKKTFIYGIVGAVLVFIGDKAINAVWDRVFNRVEARVAAIQN